jgi:photosynthetic reaction center cytochrome c subunit
MRAALSGVALLGAFAITLIAVLTFTRPPIDIIATGNPGTGMQLNYVPAQVASALAINKAPPALPPIDAGPPASTVYKNVQVLGNVSSGAFTRLMVSMTNWVAPQQGCNYCHVAGNFADDSKYTKVIARRMLQMTIAVNTQYTNHVGAVGVTCYTCHRGANVPSQVWFSGVTPGSGPGLAETAMGKNLPVAAINSSSLPSDPFTPFLLNNAQIRDQGTTALPTGTNAQSIKQTDWTYALMMHYSQALGVNCAFCHNSRAFSDWTQSTPQRVTAFYAEAMLRDLNANYMVPLTSTFPAEQRGPSGDVAKINCATCHQGVYKPLFGTAMAAQFPPLEGTGATAASATMAPATAAGTKP